MVDKTAEYVAKNSDDFERTVLERHIGDTRFSFLNPWDQFHPYYQFMKQHNRTQLEQGDTPTLPIRPLFEEEASERPNLQKLSSSGAVSFKLQNKQNSSSAVLPATCSEFGTEESEEGEMEAGEGEGGGEEPPPAKKQRVENDGRTEDDDIGLTVQVRGENSRDSLNFEAFWIVRVFKAIVITSVLLTGIFSVYSGTYFREHPFCSLERSSLWRSKMLPI